MVFQSPQARQARRCPLIPITAPLPILPRRVVWCLQSPRPTADINPTLRIRIAPRNPIPGMIQLSTSRSNFDPHPSRNSSSSSGPPLYPSRSSDPAGYGYNAPPSQSHPPRLPLYQPPSRHVHLFDPDHPQCPHPVLMPHYLQTFFERFGPEFAFLEYEDVMAEFWDRTLPPIIANCIAAMASRCAPIELRYL